MERRNRSLEALDRLMYVDTLDEKERAAGLKSWSEKYLTGSEKIDFDLEHKDLIQLRELYFKNIAFLKKFNSDIHKELSVMRKMKTYLENS